MKKRYSNKFKLKVIESVIRGEFTKESARVHYQIGGKSTILTWMKEFALEKTFTSANFVSLQETTDKDFQIRDLEEKLRLSELQTLLWQQIVKEAEKQLDIHIVQKSGAQQLDN